jgi:phosphoserine aminotransferase
VDKKDEFIRRIAGELSKAGVAHDIAAYRDAPPGFRFWCGPTVEPSDIGTALQALEDAYRRHSASLG